MDEALDRAAAAGVYKCHALLPTYSPSGDHNVCNRRCDTGAIFCPKVHKNVHTRPCGSTWEHSSTCAVCAAQHRPARKRLISIAAETSAVVSVGSLPAAAGAIIAAKRPTARAVQRAAHADIVSALHCPEYNTLLFTSSDHGQLMEERAYVGASGIKLRVRLARHLQPANWLLDVPSFRSCLEDAACVSMSSVSSSSKAACDEADGSSRAGAAAAGPAPSPRAAGPAHLWGQTPFPPPSSLACQAPAPTPVPAAAIRGRAVAVSAAAAAVPAHSAPRGASALLGSEPPSRKPANKLRAACYSEEFPLTGGSGARKRSARELCAAAEGALQVAVAAPESRKQASRIRSVSRGMSAAPASVNNGASYRAIELPEVVDLTGKAAASTSPRLRGRGRLLSSSSSAQDGGGGGAEGAIDPTSEELLLEEVLSASLTMDLQAAPVSGDSWLNSILIDWVSLQLAKRYPQVHLLPCNFMAYEVHNACKAAAAEATSAVTASSAASSSSLGSSSSSTRTSSFAATRPCDLLNREVLLVPDAIPPVQVPFGDSSLVEHPRPWLRLGSANAAAKATPSLRPAAAAAADCLVPELSLEHSREPAQRASRLTVGHASAPAAVPVPRAGNATGGSNRGGVFSVGDADVGEAGTTPFSPDLGLALADTSLSALPSIRMAATAPTLPLPARDFSLPPDMMATVAISHASGPFGGMLPHVPPPLLPESSDRNAEVLSRLPAPKPVILLPPPKRASDSTLSSSSAPAFSAPPQQVAVQMPEFLLDPSFQMQATTAALQIQAALGVPLNMMHTALLQQMIMQQHMHLHLQQQQQQLQHQPQLRPAIVSTAKGGAPDGRLQSSATASSCTAPNPNIRQAGGVAASGLGIPSSSFPAAVHFSSGSAAAVAPCLSQSSSSSIAAAQAIVPLPTVYISAAAAAVLASYPRLGEGSRAAVLLPYMTTARPQRYLRPPQYSSPNKPLIFFWNQGNMHWNLVRVFTGVRKEIEIFEPMGRLTSRNKVLHKTEGLSLRSVPRDLIQWLDLVCPLPTADGWKARTVAAITSQQQGNGFDCGVACLLYAEKCLQGYEKEDIMHNTDQQEITQYRELLSAYFAKQRQRLRPPTPAS